jgi:hypothetical protein
MPSVICAAFSCTPVLADAPAALADTVTACATFTAETVAEKPPFVAPGASVMDAGTTNEELLLVRFTFSPPIGTAAFVDIVQLSVPAPVMVLLAQLTRVNCGTPLP